MGTEKEVLHCELVAEIQDELIEADFASTKHMCTPYIKPAEFETVKDFCTLVQKLKSRGHAVHWKHKDGYSTLIDVFKRINRPKIVELIEEYGNKLKVEAGSFQDNQMGYGSQNQGNMPVSQNRYNQGNMPASQHVNTSQVNIAQRAMEQIGQPPMGHSQLGQIRSNPMQYPTFNIPQEQQGYFHQCQPQQSMMSNQQHTGMTTHQLSHFPFGTPASQNFTETQNTYPQNQDMISCPSWLAASQNQPSPLVQSVPFQNQLLMPQNQPIMSQNQPVMNQNQSVMSQNQQITSQIQYSVTGQQTIEESLPKVPRLDDTLRYSQLPVMPHNQQMIRLPLNINQSNPMMNQILTPGDAYRTITQVLGGNINMLRDLGEDCLLVGIYLQIPDLGRLNARQLLEKWLSNCGADRSKLVDLYKALVRSKRPQLADKLVHSIKGLPVVLLHSSEHKYLQDAATQLRGDHWRQVGLELGFEEQQLESLDSKYNKYTKLRNLDMLYTWFETICDRAEGKRILDEALEKGEIKETTNFRRFKKEELDIDKSHTGLLGIGGSGHVCFGKLKTEGYIPVAIKYIFDANKVPSAGLPRDTEKNLLKEAKVMYQISRNSVVRIFGVYIDEPENIYAIVMEHMKHKSLLIFMQLVSIPVSIKAEMMKDISNGFKHLHHEGIIHGDVKLDNILISDKFKAKIADFGLAKLRAITSTTELAPTSDTRAVRGTFAYTAPERFAPAKFNLAFPSRTKETDVWSFGVSMYYLLTGHLPFEAGNYEGLSWQVLNKDISMRDPSSYDAPVLAELALRCLKKTPKIRPTFEVIAKELYEKYNELYQKHETKAHEELRQSWEEIEKEIEKLRGNEQDPDPVDHKSGERVHQEIEKEICYILEYM